MEFCNAGQILGEKFCIRFEEGAATFPKWTLQSWDYHWWFQSRLFGYTHLFQDWFNPWNFLVASFWLQRDFWRDCFYVAHLLDAVQKSSNLLEISIVKDIFRFEIKFLTENKKMCFFFSNSNWNHEQLTMRTIGSPIEMTRKSMLICHVKNKKTQSIGGPNVVYWLIHFYFKTNSRFGIH